MSDIDLGVAPVELPPAIADQLRFQRETVELEAEALKRWLWASPSAWTFTWRAVDAAAGGAPTQAEQTAPGDQREPFHGVAIFNPSPYPVAIGFEAGAGVFGGGLVCAAASWLVVPQRYTNLSLQLRAPTNTGALDTLTLPLVNVVAARLRLPPMSPNGGPLGPLASVGPIRGVAIPAGTPVGAAGSAGGDIQVSGARWLYVISSLATVTSADLSGNLQAYDVDGVLAPVNMPVLLSSGPTGAAGVARTIRQYDVTGLERVRAIIANAGAGATTGGVTYQGR